MKCMLNEKDVLFRSFPESDYEFELTRKFIKSIARYDDMEMGELFVKINGYIQPRFTIYRDECNIKLEIVDMHNNNCYIKVLDI